MSAISASAYTLLHDQVIANRQDFYVYKDADSAFNHGFPSGFFGTSGKLQIDAAAIDSPSSPKGFTLDPSRLDRVRGNILRVTFAPMGSKQFAGLNIEEPKEWSIHKSGDGYDLRGATRVLFDVRSPTAGGITVRFGVAGRNSAYIHIPQRSTFTTMSISLVSLGLTPATLRRANVLFSVSTNGVRAPKGGTVLLDNIRFDPVPTAQKTALSFPLANKTFGVVPRQTAAPGRVAFPLDQVLRNLSTVYESSLTLMTLLRRGAAQDLRDARLLADTFAYALTHDSHGIPLPLAPDFSAGLHNAYSAGDISVFNSQRAPGVKQKGDSRLAGFSCSLSDSGYCVVLDGATGGNNAFAVMALAAAYRQFRDVRYLVAARTIGHWIIGNLLDNTGTGYGGYHLGYEDEGKTPKAQFMQRGKSVENNADIFAAFTALAAIERQLGDAPTADAWAAHAKLAGDFVMAMFDADLGRFNAGTVPVGQSPDDGIDPTGEPRGNEVINVYDLLDSNTFSVLALASSPLYRDQIDWRRPIQYLLQPNGFVRSIQAAGRTFYGFNIAKQPTDGGPNGIAWEFTGQAVAAMKFVDRLYGETQFQGLGTLFLNSIAKAQAYAPFGDGRGLVASTVVNGDKLAPIDQSLSTPFQPIAERVGLAATNWAILADRDFNLFVAP